MVPRCYPKTRGYSAQDPALAPLATRAEDSLAVTPDPQSRPPSPRLCPPPSSSAAAHGPGSGGDDGDGGDGWVAGVMATSRSTHVAG